MDPVRERSLLVMAVFIATTVLQTSACGDELNKTSDDYFCTCKKCDCVNLSDSVFTTQQMYCEFTPGNAPNYTCPNDNICDEGTWFKAEKCGANIKMKNIRRKGLLSFGNSLNSNDLGKYFCLMNGQNRRKISRSNTPPVVVKLKGMDTYLVTFKCEGCETYPIAERMPCIDYLVNYLLSLNLTKCSFVLQHVTTISEPHVEGYFYIAKSEDTNKFINNTNFSDGNDSANLTLKRGKFLPVSFCPQRNFSNDSVGNLIFNKTEVGRNASSLEVCPDGTPRAFMKCEGNFINASIWVTLEVKNCKAEDDTNNSLSTEDVNLSTKIDHELTMGPTTNLPEGDHKVTTVNTAESAIALRKYINKVPVTKDNVNVVSRLLYEGTKHPENCNATHLMWISEILKNISEIGSSSHEVARHVVEVVENLINVKEDVYEKSLSGGTPTMILRALETQLTNLHKEETNFTFIKSSLGVAARQLYRSAFGENMTFGGFSLEVEDNTERQSNVSFKTGNDNSKFLATITLPASLLDEIPIGHNDKIPVTFIIHRTSLFFMSSYSWQRSHSERVASGVVAATIEGHNIANLRSPVISKFQLPHVDEPMPRSRTKCVFWNFTLANGLGDWSSEGCELANSSEHSTGLIIECHCNHLTNFAVLLDVQGDIDHVALDTLSKVGCVVSTFALVITLIVLLAIKKLREQVPQKIIINLCVALLGLYICFLVGIDQSSLETGCVIFGALIHYFCLASVAWMCVVATNMYLLFVRVFNANVNGFMWKAYFAAWGFPMIVVIVSVILNHQDYNKSYCFPETETLTFYLGVVLVIGLMLCYNLVIFILIIRQVTCKRIGRPAGQDKRTEMIERVQSIIIISILLGLTWLFGFLSIGDARYIFNPLFLVFNTLQGFFVFVFFILRPKNVRMILFKCCYRHQDGNTGSYTVNKSKTDGTNDQKDTLNMDDVVTSSELCDSHSNS